MELEKYIDRKKALDYIVVEANKQGFSLNELCKGIYDSSNFYKIINGRDNRGITYEKLMILCGKLNLSLEDLINNCVLQDVTMKDKLDGLRQFCFLEDYAGLGESLKQIRDEMEVVLPDVEQYLLWHEAIYLFEHEKDIDTALNVALKAMRMSVPNFGFGNDVLYDRLKEDEMRIYNTILIIIREQDYALSEIILEYKKLITCMKGRRLVEKDLMGALYHNVLYLMTPFDDDYLELVDEGINYCVTKRAYLYLPHLYALKGYYLYKHNQVEDARECFDSSLALLEAQGHNKAVESLTLYRKERNI